MSATQDLQGYKQGEKTPRDAIKGLEDKFLIQNRKMKPNVSPIASGPSDDMLCRLLNSHHRTVDAEIIILRNPPISAGIGVIVFFASFVLFMFVLI